MIGYILGGLGVLGLFGIKRSLDANAAANLYSAVKDQLPSQPMSLNTDPSFRDWIRRNGIDYDFNSH